MCKVTWCIHFNCTPLYKKTAIFYVVEYTIINQNVSCCYFRYFCVFCPFLYLFCFFLPPSSFSFSFPLF